MFLFDGGTLVEISGVTQLGRPLEIGLTCAALVQVFEAAHVVRTLITVPVLRLFGSLLFDLEDRANVRWLPHFRRLFEQSILIAHFLYL